MNLLSDQFWSSSEFDTSVNQFYGKFEWKLEKPPVAVVHLISFSGPDCFCSRWLRACSSFFFLGRRCLTQPQNCFHQLPFFSRNKSFWQPNLANSSNRNLTCLEWWLWFACAVVQKLQNLYLISKHYLNCKLSWCLSEISLITCSPACVTTVKSPSFTLISVVLTWDDKVPTNPPLHEILRKLRRHSVGDNI